MNATARVTFSGSLHRIECDGREHAAILLDGPLAGRRYTTGACGCSSHGSILNCAWCDTRLTPSEIHVNTSAVAGRDRLCGYCGIEWEAAR